MTHAAYTWKTYPCTGTSNFEFLARESLSHNTDNNKDEETRLLAVEDWSAFSPNTMPGGLVLDSTIYPAKILANNTAFDGYVLTYNSASEEFSWEDMAAVIGADTYQTKWNVNGGSAFLTDFVATQLEAEEGTNTEKLMTPERTSQAIDSLLPSGMIAPFAQTTVPTGWLVCDGRAIDRAAHAKLFATIGVLYGEGDTTTTFNIPDYRGRFLRGLDAGKGVDPDSTTRTDRGDGAVGDHVGTVQTSANITHAHSVNPPNSNTSSTGSHAHSTGGGTGSHTFVSSYSPRNIGMYYGSSTGSAGAHGHSVDIPSFSSGNSGSRESRPTNINVLYCIKE